MRKDFMQNDIVKSNLPENRELTKLQYVEFLQALGFHVFPLVPNSKLPAITDYPNRASVDDKAPWTGGGGEEFNIGISTTRFNSKCALIVVDVDNKPGKKGNQTINLLELNGCPFPDTLTQITPSGGYHLIYYIEGEPVCQHSANFLGQGVDVRSRGGYIVGAGSKINSVAYRFKNPQTPIAKAPEWLIAKCNQSDLGQRKNRQADTLEDFKGINQEAALERAIWYLKNKAPLSIQNEGGDSTAFFVACMVRDFGVNFDNAFTALIDHWNDRCEPPWKADDLLIKIKNAYSYGSLAPGALAPEKAFTPIVLDDTKKLDDEPESETMVEAINKKFALITGESPHVLHETTNSGGQGIVRHLSLESFHTKLAPMQFLSNGRPVQASRAWIKSKLRREYDGIVFMPEQKASDRFYNLWRGFSVKPLLRGEASTAEQTEAVLLLRQHLLENICAGDAGHAHWIMQYFAHLVQKPWEKPHVSIVLKGSKGVGKNILIDCFGSLVESNYMLTSNRRDLLSNFNGHMENLLLLTLDEAFWSGDHQAEGILKDLITGKTINIEHKGKEKFKVNNCVRVVIIGNEDWIVPASHDERRFAVFEVGEGKKQDTKYFTRLHDLMYEKGGREYLLRVLLDYDLTGFNRFQAPETTGLTTQKYQSLKPIYQWWSDCISAGGVLSEFSGWPAKLNHKSTFDSFVEWCKNHKINSRIPNDVFFSRTLKMCCPKIQIIREQHEGVRSRFFVIPPLKTCRDDWNTFLGAKGTDWGDDQDV